MSFTVTKLTSITTITAKPTDQVRILVTGQSYARHGDDGELINSLYEGPAFFVLKEISNRHSYNQFADYESFSDMVEDGEVKSLQEMLESINEANGDGCDYISIIDLTT